MTLLNQAAHEPNVPHVCPLAALADTEWPGRNQTLKHGDVTYFLDGAHTMRSMQACVSWFIEAAAQHERNARYPWPSTGTQFCLLASHLLQDVQDLKVSVFVCLEVFEAETVTSSG